MKENKVSFKNNGELKLVIIVGTRPEIQPDAVLVLGDTNLCLSVIGAKRLHIPIFHMEAGNRCKPAICIRTSTERPESLDKACFILAGIDKDSLLQAVDTEVEMNKNCNMQMVNHFYFLLPLLHRRFLYFVHVYIV